MADGRSRARSRTAARALIAKSPYRRSELSDFAKALGHKCRFGAIAIAVVRGRLSGRIHRFGALSCSVRHAVEDLCRAQGDDQVP
jgi:hypothetical protein